jgi:alanyl aminopeptidase
MTQKVLERLHPEWRADLARLERRAAALQSDALPSARRVRQPIRTPGDIRNAFDAITYSKGATLLGMFEGWVGEDRFRRGVQSYLSRHAHGTATAADFLETLGQAGDRNLAAAFQSFLDQPGIPEVTVALRCEAASSPVFELEQRRFLPRAFRTQGASPEERWGIPIRLEVATKEGMKEFRVLLDQKRGRLELPDGTPCPQVWFGNASGVGYYLVRPGDQELEPFLSPSTPLEVGERFAFLTDLRLLVVSGELSADAVLKGLEPWIRASERQLVEAAAGIVRTVRRWVPEERTEAYAAWVRRQFGPQLEALGRLPAPGEPEDRALLRNHLIRLLAGEGADRELRAWARERVLTGFEDPAVVPAAVRSAVLKAAAAGGDERLWDWILERARREPNRRLRQELLVALGQFEDLSLLARSWGVLLDPAWDIRDALAMLQELPASPQVRSGFQTWIEQNLDPLLSRLPEQLRARIPGWSAELCSKQDGARLRAILEPKLSQEPGFERNLNLALETIEMCAAAAPIQRAALDRFFTAN